MSYPHSELADGEKLIVHRHSHWKTLIIPSALGVATIVAGSYLAVLVSGPAGRVGVLAVVVLVAVAVLRFTVAPVLRWRATHFVLTDRKLMFREGVLRRASMNIPLSRVQSVRVDRDLNDRLFGCGSLVIEAASDDPLTFTDIPHVEHVHMLLYQAMDGGPLTHLTAA